MVRTDEMHWFRRAVQVYIMMVALRLKDIYTNNDN